MRPNLADDILQGLAKGDEFRTAPLWGLGQRIFFLHDGRTNDLEEAIQAHRSAANSKFGASEANAVIDKFNRLGSDDQQDLLNSSARSSSTGRLNARAQITGAGARGIVSHCAGSWP
jgi:CxxC motif-containing protein (DUF1111 family)